MIPERILRKKMKSESRSQTPYRLRPLGKTLSAAKVDVAVPTYHPDEKYDRLLRGLLKQKKAVSRILVINTDREGYREPALGKRKPEVTHIDPKEFDHAATRNALFQKTTGDFVLFMTQDAVPVDDKLVSSLLAAFADPKVAVAYARQMPAEDCDIIERYTRRFNYPAESRLKTAEDLPELGIKTFFCSDVCAMYRREAFEKLGGFPDRAIFNEDMVFARKAINAGYRIAYVAEARVIHSHNYTPIQQLRRNFDMGVSQTEFAETFRGITSEKTGVKMVFSTAAYLVKTGHSDRLPKLFVMSGCKFLGYRLGKAYTKLPRTVVFLITTNRDYMRRLRIV